MSELGPNGVPAAPQDGVMALLASLDALRAEGAQHLDPARFHYLEVLARRTQAASGAVQHLLQGQLHSTLAAYGERFRQARTTASAPMAQPAQRSPLTQLNQYIQTLTHKAPQDGLDSRLGSEEAPPSEMKSLRRFREAWSKMAAEDQVTQAVGRGPDNPGPLNSHMLVLRSLALMRDLSPDYLRRFLSHVDALLWLEQASPKHTPAPAKPARKNRPKARQG